MTNINDFPVKANPDGSETLYGTDATTDIRVTVQSIADMADVDVSAKADQTALDTHVGDTTNPHNVTKTQVGLGSVDNTADADKPVSTAQAAADALKADVSHVHPTSEVTGLDTALAGKVDDAQVLTDVPAGALFTDTTYTDAEIKTAYENNGDTNAFTDADKTKLDSLEESAFLGTFANASALETAFPAASATAGQFADVDAGVGQEVQRYVLDDDDNVWRPSVSVVGGETAASVKTKYESNADTNAYTDAEQTKMANVPADTTADIAAKEDSFTKNSGFNKDFGTIAGTVSEGNHTHTKADVGLANVDNTADADKPVSTAQQTALDGKVDDAQVLTDVPSGAIFTDTVYDDTALSAAVALNTAKVGYTDTLVDSRLSDKGIEDNADVTDTANVTEAGALMDSEVDADLKTLALPANTTISTFGATLVDDADATAARSTLNVDLAGTDNSTDVTVTGEDYLSLSGQAITANAIDLDNLSATGTTDSTTFLRGDNTWAVPAGGGGVGTTEQTITQTAHGFTVAQILKISGGEYALAQGDTAPNAEVAGVVVEVVDANTFKLAQSGFYSIFTGLTADEAYVLDHTNAGDYTLTATSTEGEVNRPVLLAKSATEAWILPYRGNIVSAVPSGITNLAVANATGTTIDVTSDTGTDATLPAADATDAGLMAAADKAKLDLITVTSAADLDALLGIKAIVVENPTATEDITIFKTTQAATVTEISVVVRGATPSVTWTLRFNTDRSATGTEVITGGTATTSEAGVDITTFDASSIPANSYVWLETTAQTGTVDELSLTLKYTV